MLTIEHIEFCLHQLSGSRLNLQSSLALLLTFYPTINRSTVVRMLWPFVGFDIAAVSRCSESCQQMSAAKVIVLLWPPRFVLGEECPEAGQNFEPMTKLEPSVFGASFAYNGNTCKYSSTSEHAKLKYSKKMQSE